MYNAERIVITMDQELLFLRVEEQIKSSTYDELEQFVKEHSLEIDDSNIEDGSDYAERILLTYRKMQGYSHNPYPKFAEVHADIRAKSDALEDIMNKLYSICLNIPARPMSQVLLEEKLLKGDDFLQEFTARIHAIKETSPLIITAGETNAGKSTCLNVWLGVDILPTDVLHCTIAICKIKYSKTYRVETLDFNNERQTFPCQGWQEANLKLKEVAAEKDMRSREKGTAFKEITVYMPSKILMSGVTLVDTPGIGETPEMDDVTMDYIRCTGASAFIYVVKSDSAGGIQQDRLVRFLQAIQDDYKTNSIEGAIDPRAALFICNRWDNIEKSSVEMVKKNAVTKLDIVWPGFDKKQMHFFSSKKVHHHLSADSEFVMDELNDLLLGFMDLCNTAAHNNIKHQYSWTKYFMQLTSQHLSSWINHCNSSKEKLEETFRTIASKQDALNTDSQQFAPFYMATLNDYRVKLKNKVKKVLSEVDPELIDDYDQLLSFCSTGTFLRESKNRQSLDQWIVPSLINYCDVEIQRSGILAEMERDTTAMIKDNMGLIEDQVKEITALVKGKSETSSDNQLTASEWGSSNSSSSSCASYTISLGLSGDTFMDPTMLDQAVRNHIGTRRKSSSGILKSLPRVKSRIMTALTGTSRGPTNRYQNNPQLYLNSAIEQNCKSMKDNKEIIEGFAAGYLRLIERYIKSTIERIPHFIEVNNIQMDKIRENRQVFQDDRFKLRLAMKDLEPFRELLRAYGLSYIEDIHADMILFNTRRRDSTIDAISLADSCESRDSGIPEIGSSRNRVRGFFTNLRNAIITIDDKPSDVIIKLYTCHIDRTHQLSEIASLRSLEHPSLAQFFGMTRIVTNEKSQEEETNSPQKLSSFIFKGNLVSARVFSQNRLISKRKFVRELLQGLLSGLEFIHLEEMVHLELNMDTVMVNVESENVQLCQQCLPREVEVPSDVNVRTNAWVCLSPSVLQGHKYESCDDIYAFGLLLWELLFPYNLPYKEERHWPLQRFKEEVSPKNMLEPEIDKLDGSQTVISLLKGSLVTGKGKICMAMTDIKRNLADLHSDQAIRRMSFDRRPAMRRDRVVKSAGAVGAQQIQRKGQSIYETTPQRPPRKKDAFRNGEKGSQCVNPNSERRSSVPASFVTADLTAFVTSPQSVVGVNQTGEVDSTDIGQKQKLPSVSETCDQNRAKNHMIGSRDLPDLMASGKQSGQGNISLRDGTLRKKGNFFNFLRKSKGVADECDTKSLCESTPTKNMPLEKLKKIRRSGSDATPSRSNVPEKNNNRRVKSPLIGVLRNERASYGNSSNSEESVDESAPTSSRPNRRERRKLIPPSRYSDQTLYKTKNEISQGELQKKNGSSSLGMSKTSSNFSTIQCLIGTIHSSNNPRHQESKTAEGTLSKNTTSLSLFSDTSSARSSGSYVTEPEDLNDSKSNPTQFSISSFPNESFDSATSDPFSASEDILSDLQDKALPSVYGYSSLNSEGEHGKRNSLPTIHTERSGLIEVHEDKLRDHRSNSLFENDSFAESFNSFNSSMAGDLLSNLPLFSPSNALPAVTEFQTQSDGNTTTGNSLTLDQPEATQRDSMEKSSNLQTAVREQLNLPTFDHSFGAHSDDFLQSSTISVSLFDDFTPSSALPCFYDGIPSSTKIKSNTVLETGENIQSIKVESPWETNFSFDGESFEESPFDLSTSPSSFSAFNDFTPTSALPSVNQQAVVVIIPQELTNTPTEHSPTRAPICLDMPSFSLDSLSFMNEDS